MPCLLMHSLLCIQSCQSYRKMLGKIQAREGEGDSGGALLDLPKLVSQIAETTGSSCMMITRKETFLTLPGCQKRHLLRRKLNLLACHLCGDCKNRGFSE